MCLCLSVIMSGVQPDQAGSSLCLCVHVCVCLCVCLYVCMCMCMCVLVCVCVNECACVFVLECNNEWCLPWLPRRSRCSSIVFLELFWAPQMGRSYPRLLEKEVAAVAVTC